MLCRPLYINTKLKGMPIQMFAMIPRPAPT